MNNKSTYISTYFYKKNISTTGKELYAYFSRKENLYIELCNLDTLMDNLVAYNVSQFRTNADGVSGVANSGYSEKLNRWVSWDASNQMYLNDIK